MIKIMLKCSEMFKEIQVDILLEKNIKLLHFVNW